ncbi:MAG: lamin tail domain-containing protein [Patescibacteria group bacterium]|nr:lamin tail domain-containing protein [Patescibacteria group bacterium]
MHQFIGLVLLILAVSVGLYAATHYAQLTSFQVPLPSGLHPVNYFSSTQTPTSGTQYQNIPQLALPAHTSQNPVRIDSVVQASAYYHPYIEVVLASNAGPGQKIDITGWTVKSKNGSFTIPQAQAVYSFGGVAGDITLQSGEYVHIYSGEATKGNFRLNKCMGYIEDQTPFTPSIPMTCPVPNRSQTTAFTSECQDYVTSLRTCQNPSANPPVPMTDTACFEFLRKLNYVGCVDAHIGDSDFASNQWWAWIGSKENIFDPTHDDVQLINKQGTVVDEYTY